MMMHHNLKSIFAFLSNFLYQHPQWSGCMSASNGPSSSTTLLPRLCAQQERPRRGHGRETARAEPRPSPAAGTAPRVIPKPRNKDRETSRHAGSGIWSVFVDTLVHLPPSGTRAKLTDKHSSGEGFLVCNMLHITDMSYVNILKALKACN